MTAKEERLAILEKEVEKLKLEIKSDREEPIKALLSGYMIYAQDHDDMYNLTEAIELGDENLNSAFSWGYISVKDLIASMEIDEDGDFCIHVRRAR